MNPRDLDDFMRRTVDHLRALEERIAELEERDSVALPAWDDVQVSIANLRIPVSNAPTWITWNYGIGGGISFAILGFDIGDTVDLFIQSSHAMKLEDLLDYHIHWSINANASGDRFQFQVDAIAAGINESFAVVSGSPFTAEYILDGAESGKHNLFELAEMDGVNTTISTAYIIKLTRIAATTNDYTDGDGYIYLIFSDGHYRRDSIGSRQESVK